MNGQPHPYERSGNDLIFSLTIPAGESRYVDITYENDLDLASIDISKNVLRVNILRRLSDFRDNALASNVLGRTFVYYYYKKGFYKAGSTWLSVLLFLVVCMAFVYLYSRKRLKQRQL